MLDALDLNTLGLGNIQNNKDFDFDLEELTNEVDGLESLAAEMEKLNFLDNVDNGFDITNEKLTDIEERKPKRPKGGKRKKKQAKRGNQMKKSERRGSGSGSSVTLCQLMNICDTIPMGSNRIEEKSQSPHSDLPFASSLRSELVVEAPDSMTSDSNIDPVMIDLTEVKEKKPRMEDVNFQDGRPSHREIDFSQGIPVRTKEDKSRSRAQPLMTDNLMSGMDDSMPISSIDFDFKPNAPTARNAGQADTAFAAGNLYENMAKQLEAFLEGQETRHPKMVDALISNTTHVVIGGNEMNNLNIEEHVFNISNDLEDISTTAATSMVAEAYNDKHDNTNEITDNAFPAFDMENHVKGEKDIRADKAPNKTFIESGWTPLVIGSLPGISAKSNTSFMSRMLDMTTRNHTRDLRDLWRPSGPVLMSRRD
eukprot:TRINITY_DN9572_c0_g1_i1.p1 TRINITY_DN9572_c0_g1~~TRINITY_DN9572_c0_g1_i1.p1  ORF type:complete len:424 (+),score=122.91 TRINITY_DN9572_c0_g1_i1:82-1353(+)